MVKTKRLIALSLILIALLLAPMISNAATSNQWTPILSLQVDTQPKAITTAPLGDNIDASDNLVYDALMMMWVSFPEPDYDGGWAQLNFTFDYNYGTWGDWFIVNMNDTGYFAIHNTTREIGLNGTDFFYTLPDNESVINRQTDVYSFMALPTGIKAGDHIKVMMPLPSTDGEGAILLQITTDVLGRITSPLLYGAGDEFYDTWIVSSTFTNSSISLALQLCFDSVSGLPVIGVIGGTGIFTNGSPSEVNLGSIELMLEFNSSASIISDPETLQPLPYTGVEGYESIESTDLRDGTFTYNETGNWWLDASAISDGALGKVTLTNLAGSYLNFTVGPISGYDIPLNIGLSQVVKIPDSLWEFMETVEGPGCWNDTYYDNITRTGHIDYIEPMAIVDFTRFMSGEGFPFNLPFLAPPWIRDGSVFVTSAFIPMFVPEYTEPEFGPIDGAPVSFLIPFRVTGAVTVNIGGYDFDCWKAKIVLPTGFKDLNVSKFSFDLYFERTTGMLVKAQTEVEGKMPFEEDVWCSFGVSKTWTLSDFNGFGVPPPEELDEYVHNTYYKTESAYQQFTLDPSILNGGSVTVECSENVNVSMFTQTQSDQSWYVDTINGTPVVKFLNVTHNATGSANFNATINFYYTPSELRAMGARESGFTIYAWNGTAWEPLNTTWDAEGRVVSANTTHFSVFALGAAPRTLLDILGPILPVIFLNNVFQAASPSVGGLPISVAIGGALLAVMLVAVIILARRH